MLKYPAVRFVYDRRGQANATKRGSVDIEIKHEGRRKWISTGVRVLPNQWHPDFRVVMHPDANHLNLRLEGMFNPLMKFINSLIVNEKPCAWTTIEEFLSFGCNAPESFIDYMSDSISNRTDLRPTTKKNHRTVLGVLKKFGLLRTFDDLTKDNIRKFDQWLKGHEKYVQTTVASYHKILKVYINEAIRNDLMKDSPYKAMKIDRGRPKLRRYLTKEELKKLCEADMPSKSYEAVRKVFLFQCYTGLSYVDLYRFDFKNVINREGKFVIHDTRVKTGEEFYVVLLPKAMHILKYFNFKLPEITNQQYNQRLKVVGAAAGLKQSLTTHMARHTYASLCINAGIKIEVVSKMLGHSNIMTTQTYAKMLNTTVEKAYDVLENFI